MHFYRFWLGIMSGCCSKFSRTAIAGCGHRLQVIKGPVTKYLPLECTRLGFSWAAEQKVRLPCTLQTASIDVLKFSCSSSFDHMISTCGLDTVYVLLLSAHALGQLNRAASFLWGHFCCYSRTILLCLAGGNAPNGEAASGQQANCFRHWCFCSWQD